MEGELENIPTSSKIVITLLLSVAQSKYLHTVLFLCENSLFCCKNINDIALHALRFGQLEKQYGYVWVRAATGVLFQRYQTDAFYIGAYCGSDSFEG